MSQAPLPHGQAQALAAELYAVLKGRVLPCGLVLAALDLVRDQVVKRRAVRGPRDPALIDLAERTRMATKPSAKVQEHIQRIKRGV